MVLTSLELKDKTFGTKFRGYDPEEVDEFLDIVTDDYEELVRKNHEQEMEIKSLKDRLTYFDELKESLSQSVILAQDTAEKVKIAAKEQASTIIKQAEYDGQSLLNLSKDKANEILRTATDNAKKVAVETEELKNKTRVFHQRLKSTIESQLALVDSPEWEEILRPTASYLQTSDEAFREVLEEALAESVDTSEDSLDVTRQMSAEEVAELVQKAEALEQEAAQAVLQEEVRIEE
ncbi:cell division protein DivIVA [Streptococcus azizii]|uniref:Cell division protein DivIVA n=1 Tax=Streptococcus azizii TaxID=1579424 RepID=A0AB36JPM0_9STRE|nr:MULTISPECIES: DivIVA domain-containing protein [Streptococcus]MBF0775252.1 DivIVA domain-containing protein [Streptococcus sp. 19428wD3_AN2]ONK29527.1 cell division protein DivIVA [Streptococcus azizii]ONK30036.1 cell division protein DivIVA [Streptococcus azizii]ONK30812.1 cell division protein DivIVA [Streptococcus azizii]TFU84781.1 DivIVA domain-containing protein [Streptococcus sp. AN2]